MRIACLLCVLLTAVAAAGGPADACRFWGLVGDGYPVNMIVDQLREGTPTNLRQLSNTHRDGWGIAFVHNDTEPHALNRPIVRRGGSPANHPGILDFGLAVDELETIRPRVAIAHVRKCTISHCGVPDPHPFQREGILFAHNGRMSDSLMVALLTADDPDYLLNNPPDYDSTYIDSELYFLYLLQYGHRHPEESRADALRHAVYELSMLTQTRLNFVLASGDTLFVLRQATGDELDPVRFYPAGLSPSPYWIAASQALGSEPEGWTTVPARTLAVLVPGQAPVLLAVTAGPTSGVAAPAPGIRIGRVTPNPSRGEIAIPISAPEAGVRATCEVLDAGGRIVWRSPPQFVLAGVQDLIWDARDLHGQAVANGSYWCRVRVGTERSEQRIVIVR